MNASEMMKASLVLTAYFGFMFLAISSVAQSTWAVSSTGRASDF